MIFREFPSPAFTIYQKIKIRTKKGFFKGQSGSFAGALEKTPAQRGRSSIDRFKAFENQLMIRIPSSRIVLIKKVQNKI